MTRDTGAGLSEARSDVSPGEAPAADDAADPEGLPAVTSRQLAIHVGLFLACCATTWWFAGPYFAMTLMAILLCHELGHYVMGRRRGVDASLPYFIPVPPFISLGTLGAVIRMRKPISDRNALFDVGAAGPVAGLVVAIPLLIVGLLLSSVGPVTPGDAIRPADMIEGNSILYALLKYAVFGRWLPSNGIDVQLHPMAFAGWVGLLLTTINLMPIGQLDGGHIARAALGQAHERWSARLHVVLPIVGLVAGSVMFMMARDAGRGILAALLYAKDGLLPWLVWTALLAWLRWRAGEYHPAVGEVPLDPRRRGYAIAMLVLFLLIATPVPFREAL